MRLLVHGRRTIRCRLSTSGPRTESQGAQTLPAYPRPSLSPARTPNGDEAAFPFNQGAAARACVAPRISGLSHDHEQYCR